MPFDSIDDFSPTPGNVDEAAVPKARNMPPYYVGDMFLPCVS